MIRVAAHSPLLADEGLLVTEQADEGLDLVPVPPLPARDEPALPVFFIGSHLVCTSTPVYYLVHAASLINSQRYVRLIW